MSPTAYALLLVLSLATPAWADFKSDVGTSNSAVSFTGAVIRFLEGDTLEVLHNHHPERIRLNGIDCPEQGQPYALLAKHLASDLVFKKEVTLQTYGLDEHGNTIGDLILSDGMNLNHELVRKGLCWWYRGIGPGDALLEGLEKEAREAKKGLWNDPQRVPPWEWRRRKE